MSLADELAAARAKFDTAVDNAMELDVAEDVKTYIQMAVQSEVYEGYTPTEYERRGTGMGGLQDRDVMEVKYSPSDHLLEVADMSTDFITGRLIAPVVESGTGYTWEASEIYQMQPYPRPFHKVAEKNIIQSGDAEMALELGLKRQGYERA